MSSPRVCDVCSRDDTQTKFYNKHPTCRSCLIKAGWASTPAIPLRTRVEAHRQEREVQRHMREELKKIARARLKARKVVRREKARRDIMPVPPAVAVAVDPAVKELAQRELSRRRLIEFIKEFHPRYKAGWVHHDICKRLEKFLEDVAAGKSPRLMILMPPRHGKSQIASKLFPAWAFGHYPHYEFIASSYNVSLALEFSREVRAVVRSDRYEKLFPNTKIDPEVMGAEAWKLLSPTGTGAGGYVAAGIGGPITGKGAHILVVDDPVKNAEEADSVDQRNKIWDWYKSAAYTRLAPGGGILVIQTCWHDDDLAGRLQQSMKDAAEDDPDVDHFEIVKYPAIAVEDEEFRAEGEPLHAERYDIAALNKIKRNIGVRFWAALYQQDPVPDDGAYFSKEMIHWRNENVDLDSVHIYQAWDFAISDKRQNDYNVGVTFALDYNDVAQVMEVRRFKTKHASEIVDSMLDMYTTWKKRARTGVQLIGAEDGQIWRTMQSLLSKTMRERSVYPTFEVLKPLTDKQVRARPLQGRMQQEKVKFPPGMTLDSPAIRELLRFPAGINDDVVDALAWCITILMGKAPPRRMRSDTGRKSEKTVAEKLRSLSRNGRTSGPGPMSA
jgi:hypothetical protein